MGLAQISKMKKDTSCHTGQLEGKVTYDNQFVRAYVSLAMLLSMCQSLLHYYIFYDNITFVSVIIIFSEDLIIAKLCFFVVLS